MDLRLGDMAAAIALKENSVTTFAWK
jgi:hypothetical protein